MVADRAFQQAYAQQHLWPLQHLEKTGQKPSHQLFKEIAAGIAAGEVDKLCETKGLDYIDREKAKCVPGVACTLLHAAPHCMRPCERELHSGAVSGSASSTLLHSAAPGTV